MPFVLSLATLPWLLGAAILFVVLCYTTEKDQPFIGTLSLLVVLGFCQVATAFQPLTLVTESPGAAVVAFLAYLVIGPFVGALKWASFAYNCAEEWQKARDRAVSDRFPVFKTRNPDFDPNNLTQGEKQNLLSTTQSLFGYEVEMPLEVTKHKSRVINWMVFWPVTLFWLALHDPIRRFWNFSFRAMTDLLRRISDRAMASVRVDFQ